MRRHSTFIRSILILSSYPHLGLLSRLFPSGPSTKTLYTPHTFYSPAHLIRLDLITQTILGEQHRSLSSPLFSFSPLPCYLVPLRPKYLSQYPILEFSLRYSLNVSDQVSHPYKATDKVIAICIIMSIFFDEIKT